MKMLVAELADRKILILQLFTGTEISDVSKVA